MFPIILIIIERLIQTFPILLLEIYQIVGSLESTNGLDLSLNVFFPHQQKPVRQSEL